MSGGTYALLINQAEQYEQPRKHHVLYRTSLRYGPARESSKLCQDDAAGYLDRGGRGCTK